LKCSNWRCCAYPALAGTGGLARDFDRFRAELGKLRRKQTSSLHASEPRAKTEGRRTRSGPIVDCGTAEGTVAAGSVASSKPHDFAELAHRHREVLMALSCDQNSVAVVFEDSQGSAIRCGIRRSSG